MKRLTLFNLAKEQADYLTQGQGFASGNSKKYCPGPTFPSPINTPCTYACPTTTNTQFPRHGELIGDLHLQLRPAGSGIGPSPMEPPIPTLNSPLCHSAPESHPNKWSETPEDIRKPFHTPHPPSAPCADSHPNNLVSLRTSAVKLITRFCAALGFVPKKESRPRGGGLMRTH